MQILLANYFTIATNLVNNLIEMHQYKHLRLPKLIVYDWDNTLADTSDVITKVVNRLRSDCGKGPLPNDEILNSTGDPDCDWVIDLFGEYSDKNASKYVEYYREENHAFETKFLPNALDIIQYVEKLGIHQAALTNKESIVAHNECTELNAMHYFVKFLGRCDVEHKKPHPAGVIDIVNYTNKTYNMNLQKDEVWFVGDTMTDMACAGNYGCPGLFVGKPEWIKPKYKDFIYFMGSLQDIMNLISKLKQE